METENSFSAETADLVFGSNISQEEKAEILKEIEEVVSESKAPIGEAAQKLHPEKKGMVFPLVINILMFLAVIAAFFISNMFFEQRQGENTKETQFYLSAEGKLLEELRKESEEALRVKDEQIGAIQEELAELDRRSSELTANMEATINARENELRREMEAAMAAERERLAGAGTSQEEIQAKMLEMESRLESQNSEALDSFRAASERALADQRRELEQTISMNKSLLDEANSEKLRLEEESRAREEEMASQFEEEKATLQESTREAQAALSNLAKLQEQQLLLDDQVTGAYRSIMEKINIGEFDSALSELGSLKSLITSETVQAIPAFAKKQPVDLFILDTLQKSIETTANRAQASSSSLAAAAKLLLKVENMAIKGLEAYRNGDPDQARILLTGALEEIPSLDEGYAVLTLMETAERKENMTAAAARGDELAIAGDFDGAVLAYSEAILSGTQDNPETAASAVDGLKSLFNSRHSDTLTANTAESNRLKQEKDTALSTLETRQERVLSRIDTEHRQALSALGAEKDREIAVLQQKLAEKETALALQKIQMADTEAALMEALSSSEQELTTLLDGQSEYKAQLEAGYEEAMAELEAGYQTSLTEMETRYKEEMELLIQEKDLNMTGKDDELTMMKASLAEKDTLLVEWETKFNQLQTNFDQLSIDLTSSEIEKANLTAKLEGYKLLASDYVILKNRMDRLMSTGNPDDYFQAEELLISFLSEKLTSLLPGAGEIVEKTGEARETTIEEKARRDGVTAGRNEALADILRYTGYLAEGNSSGQSALLREIRNKAESDNQYSQVIREIEDLVMKGAEEAAEAASVLGRPQLLGTVSRVNGNIITIEILADLPVEKGMEISVRRKTRRSDEVVLADGKITDTGRDSVEAEVSGSLGAGRVEISDLVYVTLK